MIKICLFDLNGVLVDSERINFVVWQTIFKENNLDFDIATYDLYVDGKTSSELANEIYGKKGCEKTLLARKDEVWSDIVGQERLCAFDDAIVFLDNLRKEDIVCGVVTSSRKAEIILKQVRLYHYFDAIVDGNSISKGKPDPEIIFKAQRILGGTKENTLLFEDSISGIKAGISAGVNAIGVRCRNDLAKKLCRKHISTFDDISVDEILNW